MPSYFSAVFNVHGIPYLFHGKKVIHNFKEKLLSVKKTMNSNAVATNEQEEFVDRSNKIFVYLIFLEHCS